MNEEQTPTVDIDPSDIDSSDAPPNTSDELAADDTTEVPVDSEAEVIPDGDEPATETTDTGEVISAEGDNEMMLIDFLELDFVEDLQKFYKHYLVETPEGFIQIFQSLTYGELIISFLLLLLIVLYVMKWLYEIVRY